MASKIIDLKNKKMICQNEQDVVINHIAKHRNVLLLRHNVLNARKLVTTNICVLKQSKQTVTC